MGEPPSTNRGCGVLGPCGVKYRKVITGEHDKKGWEVGVNEGKGRAGGGDDWINQCRPIGIVASGSNGGATPCVHSLGNAIRGNEEKVLPKRMDCDEAREEVG